MKLQIKSIAGSLLFESEAKSILELLVGAVKSGADLSRANLSWADLSRADLSGADLSGAAGLKGIDTVEWFRKNFKKCARGVIVYKAFGMYKTPPESWKIEPGSVIAENCNPCPADDCGCGISFATREWIERRARSEDKKVVIWRCLIPWAWLPGVVIPWNTNGAARCSKLILLKPEAPK